MIDRHICVCHQALIIDIYGMLNRLSGRSPSFSKMAASSKGVLASDTVAITKSFPKDAEFFAAVHDFVLAEEGNEETAAKY
jgi:hypothetical protein